MEVQSLGARLVAEKKHGPAVDVAEVLEEEEELAGMNEVVPEVVTEVEEVVVVSRARRCEEDAAGDGLCAEGDCAPEP